MRDLQQLCHQRLLKRQSSPGNYLQQVVSQREPDPRGRIWMNIFISEKSCERFTDSFSSGRRPDT